MRKIITVIDLGSSKIAAATCGIDRSGKSSVLALENSDSRGISGGEIIDINKAVEDISMIMDRFKQQEKEKPKKVFVTTRGQDVELNRSRATIPLSKISREITKQDVRKGLEVASMIRLSRDRAIVQKFVRGFTIDGIENVRNPIGLYGLKLEIESFIATANRAKVQNIMKCIDHAGFLLDGLYLSSIASSNSVLSDEEKEKGVLLLDIGEGLTEEILFKNGLLRDVNIIKKGASFVLGEELHVDKEKLVGLLEEAMLSLPSEGDKFTSIVLTGGGALIDGIIEETERIFSVPVRIGLATNTGQRLSSKDAVIHTSTIGLINQLAKEYAVAAPHRNAVSRTLHKLLDLYETYF